MDNGLRPAAAAPASRAGRLKIFFGAAAGVGKTYAMLDAARPLRLGGVDVVVGWIDTHGSPEMAALLEGLERLPAWIPVDRGQRVEELDVDAALARRPKVLVVDELAHGNPEGMRHRRRWQDVVELLDAGIDVWTTLDVANIESLNDVVAQITDLRVGETVPDSILDRADEIELVDIPPESLIARFQEGKVHVPPGTQRAMAKLLRPGTLLALRELALRRTADRVDAEVRAYRRQHGIQATWPASERIAVCVGPGPHAARLVRAGRRMAAGLRADWAAVYVDTPGQAHLPQEDRDWVAQHLRLAESMGGRAVRLSGSSVSEALLGYAREHNVTKILAGKPTHPRWRDRFRGSLLDDIIRQSGDIEVYVSSGDPVEAPRRPPRSSGRRSPVASYLWSVVIVALAAAAAWLMFGRFHTSDLALVFLLATVIVATRFGRGPSILAAALGVAVFDFCFVPPYFSFRVRDDPYILTFVVMLVVGLTVSTLATRVRDQVEAAKSHAQWAVTLHALSRELAEARDVNAILACAGRHLREVMGGQADFLLPADGGRLVPVPASAGTASFGEREMTAAQWAFDHGAAVGAGTDTFREAPSFYLPLRTGSRTIGILAFRAGEGRPLADPSRRQVLEALALQTAGALERALIAEEAKQAEVRARTEELRNSLLSSVSHDLRTPLAAIVGSATTLLEDEGDMEPAQRADLARTVHEEADRLNRLVTNLLAMTRVESGGLALKKEWVPLEEMVGAALERIGARLEGRPVMSRLPADLPLLPVDPVLIEQVFINLLENALRYTPPGTPLEITAAREGVHVRVELADRGPGVPPGLEERLFEKFFRGPDAVPGGSGLGLTICRGILATHGGTIEAANRPEGGAVFRMTFPVGGQPPAVPTEDGEGNVAGVAGEKVDVTP